MWKISTGQQGFLWIGCHNPIIHTTCVTIGWIKLFRCLPSIKEFICIFFHDFGYLKWSDKDGFVDNHPEFGAQICGLLFGEKYYKLCISHSREYALKNHLTLSMLGYADKYSNLVLPRFLFNIILYLGGTYKWAMLNEHHRDIFASTNLDEITLHYKIWLQKNFK